MNKETVVDIYSGVLLRQRTKWCHLQEMDGTGDHHTKCSKSGSERQILHVFSHTCNLDFFKSI